MPKHRSTGEILDFPSLRSKMWLHQEPHWFRRNPITTEIGVRELKIHASEVVRDVLENRSRFLVTLRGKPAALIIPVDADYDRDKMNEVWNRLHHLREEVGKGKHSKTSSSDILEEIRK